jgi:hypothetical protein
LMVQGSGFTVQGSGALSLGRWVRVKVED